MKSKPVCESVVPWLRCNLGKYALAPLTGTDFRALSAAVQILQCYVFNPTPELLEAFRLVVLHSSQTNDAVRCLFFHAIAHVMDWGDRSKIWAICQFPPIHAPGVCAFEPGGNHIDQSKAQRASVI